jgi:Flp pilus assembly protein TadB
MTAAGAVVVGLLAGGCIVALAPPRAASVVRVPGADAPAPARRRLPDVVGRPTPVEVAVGGAVALALGLALPPLALLGLGLPLLRRRRLVHRATRARARAVAAGLPESVDLFLLCGGAGLSLPLAHPLVAERVPPPVGEALARAAIAADAGAVRADALLAELIPLGDRAAALAHVLVDHLRYGVPLVPALERLGLELRLDRRRRAEEEARRVPTRLLAPLLCCVLPAFGLLTVVPLLVATFRSLPR